MSSDTRMTDAINGYRVLAQDLVTEWSDLASRMAAKIDAEKYDGKAMFDAWAEATRLSVRTSYLMWNEALDAAAILASRPDEPNEVESDPFESPLPGATLAVKGRLVGRDSKDTLVAKVHPEKLGDRETTFTLLADATKCEGGDIYLGTVLASRGGETKPVEVFITVA
jgi:hypothetical protein